MAEQQWMLPKRGKALLGEFSTITKITNSILTPFLRTEFFFRFSLTKFHIFNRNIVIDVKFYNTFKAVEKNKIGRYSYFCVLDENAHTWFAATVTFRNLINRPNRDTGRCVELFIQQIKGWKRKRLAAVIERAPIPVMHFVL